MCLSLFENCVMQFFTDTIAEYLSHSTKKAIEAKRRRRSGKAWKKKNVFTPSINSFYGFFSNYLLPPSFFLICICQQLTNCIARFAKLQTFHYYTQYLQITQILSFLSYEFSRPKWLKMIHDNFLGCFSTTNKEAILKIICTKMNWWSNHIFLG